MTVMYDVSPVLHFQFLTNKSVSITNNLVITLAKWNRHSCEQLKLLVVRTNLVIILTIQFIIRTDLFVRYDGTRLFVS